MPHDSHPGTTDGNSRFPTPVLDCRPEMNPKPILCAHLLRKVDAKLSELLRSLTPDDWDRQTIAPRWKVRDVAAHLLDTPLRKLSMVRDKNFVERVEIRSEQDLVKLIN